MRLTSFKYFKHTLHFKNQFRTSSELMNRRQIFIVELSDENGNKYYGEAAPLPNFNSESFEEVEAEFERLRLLDSFSLGDSLDNIFTMISLLSNFPSVQFALEQIFLTVFLKNNARTHFDSSFSNSIKVNAVMSLDTFENSQRSLKKLVGDGYTTIKIKADSNNFDYIYKLLVWAVAEFEEEIKFRIDPNRSWSKKETITYCNQLESFPIEYIEQPVMDKTELFELSKICSIPIAADESLRTIIDAKEILSQSNIKFLAVKPMLFGGLARVIELQELIKNKDVQIIVSSSFESNIGKRHLVLSTAYIKNQLSHGLATADMLNNQTTEDVFKIKNGIINFSFEKYLSVVEINL